MPYGYDKGHDALFKGYYKSAISDEVNKRLNSLVVGSAQIRDLAVTNAKIANITTDKLLAGEVLISPNLLDPDFTSGIVTRFEVMEGLIESEITSVDGRISAVIQDLDGLSSYVGDEVAGINSTILQMNNSIASKVSDGQARSIFLQEASSFTFSASQINFQGHVIGQGSSWSGGIYTSQGAFIEGDVSTYGKFLFEDMGLYFQAGGNSGEIFTNASLGVAGSLDVSGSIYGGSIGTYGNATIGGTLSVGNGTIDQAGRFITNVLEHNGNGVHMYIRPASSGEVRVTSPGSTSAYRDLRANNIHSEGRIVNQGAYDTVTQSSANMYVATNGYFARSSSAKKYKKDIEPIDETYAEKFFNNVTPVWFRSKSELDNPKYSYYGYVADDVAEFEPRLVTYGSEGEVEGVNYDRTPALLHVIMKKDRRRLEALENIVGQLLAKEG